jgi:hypothetical protein
MLTRFSLLNVGGGDDIWDSIDGENVIRLEGNSTDGPASGGEAGKWSTGVADVDIALESSCIGGSWKTVVTFVVFLLLSFLGSLISGCAGCCEGCRLIADVD